MRHAILITSFATWLPHQRSNASDDLLLRFLAASADTYHTLRHLPVDHVLAPMQLIDAVDRLDPAVVVCCGMAEEREPLCVEAQADMDGVVKTTDVDLIALTEGLPMTQISYDAGDFVCNTLYYRCLEHLEKSGGGHHCVFVHVPVLTEENTERIVEAFTAVIDRLAAGTGLSPTPSSR